MKTSRTVRLRADDARAVMERRFNELMLALHIGRGRPQWAGPRAEQLYHETADLQLPWQCWE
jgi:hypothetical protein